MVVTDGASIDTRGGGNGEGGRLLIANNATNLFDGTALGTRQEAYSGARGPNPYLKGDAIQTPFLSTLEETSDVPASAETFGILDQNVVNSLNSAFSELRSMAPGSAAGAILRMDQTPNLIDVDGDGAEDPVDFTGFDTLLFLSVNNAALNAPQLGIDLDGTDSNFLVDLSLQGWERDPAFGGAGPETISQLGGLQVFATLVPETGSIFNAAVTGGQVRGAMLNAGEWAYLLPAGASGDFNGDGSLNLADIDALVLEVAAMGGDLSFDLTGDGVIDNEDVTEWLSVAGAANLPSGNPYLLGDANLDGLVDVSDFNLWNANRFSSGEAWSGADFNADGNTDVSDFNLWNVSKFTASANPSVVPEPGSCLLMVLTALGLCLSRRPRHAVSP